jgi:acid phosphatase family membrane protein YuiD
MPSISDVYAEVKLDLTKDEERKLQRRIGKIDTAKAGKDVAARFGYGFNGAFGGVVSKSAKLFVGAFAAIKGAQVFGGFINDARESAKISRITANAIRATGGAAKISADQVGALATAISNKTGIDDEQIQTAANMLLTFKQIRNETGKGNDIFNQATQAAADLSVQFGGIDGASKQLGKALNDPIKGTTALSKAGVTFTDQQKKQIKTLVESGNVLGAQKIILKEIQGQVGGAAAAAADPLARLQVIAGNLAEEVGGFLLPAVNKFANFTSNTLAPGVRALFAAFQEGDVTSDGFVGVMERVGVAARKAFGFFKAEVLPRLKDFGGYVTGTAAPAVAGFATALAATLGPPLKDVFGFFKEEILPRLQDFAGFVTGTVIPTVATLAQKLAEDKDIIVPLVAAFAAGVAVFKTITAVVKAYAIAQGILNVVLTANPIGLVIAAIAGLAAGLIIAYKKSETFRSIVQGAFRGIGEAVKVFAPLVKAAFDIVIGVIKLWWNYYAKPILSAFKTALKTVWEQAQTFGRVVKAVWDGIKEPARAAIAYVVNAFLGFIENILQGAAKAFGWVPELGPKLKSAAQHFGEFRDEVNAKLAGIKDQDVTIRPKVAAAVRAQTASGGGHAPERFATGGGVFGAGNGTSDSIPAMLSNGEHVITAKEVRGAGGHRAVEAMRREWAGFAQGGAVGLNVKALAARVNTKDIADVAVAVARPLAQKMGDALAQTFGGPSGPPGRALSFRGQTLNERTIRMLLAAERSLGHVFRIMQGSYSTRVAASGSTHAGGGVLDTDGPGGWDASVRALRRAGFAAWHRTPSQGPWGHHIHSVAIGDPSESASAKAQVRSFLRGGDGLGGMRMGGRVLLRDNGGVLPPGMFAFNGTNRNEHVSTQAQIAQSARPIHVTIPVYLPGGQQWLAEVRGEIDASGNFHSTMGRMNR